MPSAILYEKENAYEEERTRARAQRTRKGRIAREDHMKRYHLVQCREKERTRDRENACKREKEKIAGLPSAISRERKGKEGKGQLIH